MSGSVYYQDRYWNDHSLTLEYLCRQIDMMNPTDKRWWHEYFRDSYLANGPANRALIMNCGNGWVERDLYDRGIFLQATAFDISEEFVSEASRAAGDRPVEYVCADCNSIAFDDNSFDLVVNVAAMHHVQYVDRLHRYIARWLMDDGMFLNFDYIGPHRNQYSEEHFEVVKTINRGLPAGFRAEPLIYPDVHGMLHDDPTEAIHSELVLSMFSRYFFPLERKMLGGGIAYPIMHNNSELYWEQSQAAVHCVETLLQLDELYTVSGRVPSLFAFYVGSPKKHLFSKEFTGLLMSYEAEERKREAAAESNGGIYYP